MTWGEELAAFVGNSPDGAWVIETTTKTLNGCRNVKVNTNSLEYVGMTETGDGVPGIVLLSHVTGLMDVSTLARRQRFAPS